VLALPLVLGLLLSMLALVFSLIAFLAARGRRSPDSERVAALEGQVRDLRGRLRSLEQAGLGLPTVAAPLPAAPPEAPPLIPTVGSPRVSLDLEQRIGARWATWVGVVVILVAAGLFLKWAFENEYLGPATRVAIGIMGGLLMLLIGLALHRRRDVPYLSEGLAGGGLGAMYLSLFGAHVLYGLVGAGLAFAALLVVTLMGVLVAVLSSRLSTAVLAVLGGLLTPVLLQVDQPDERNLLAYLLVLDVLALLIARFRTWPALNWLAWAGTALLLLTTFLRGPEAPHPLARLLLLSALFLVFLAAPVFRERALGRRTQPIDLLLVVANAAAYFWAVYLTLEAWRPLAEGPYAVGLAILYRLVATDYAARVPEDGVSVMVHEGVSWTFLTLAIPLALDGQWVTLAWAVQGVALLWLASRAPSALAGWAGLAALLLAGVRVVALDRYGSSGTVAVHLLVVVAFVVGGWFGGREREEGSRLLTRERLRAILWLGAVVALAVLCWREPTGLWPATLLTAETLTVGWLAGRSASPAFVLAVPFLAIALAARVLLADDDLAVAAAASLLSSPFLSRTVACLAIALSGRGLSGAAHPRARLVGRIVSGAAGVLLLLVLSSNWIRYQDGLKAAARAAGQRELLGELQWRTQVGLSVLWTLYGALVLAWGFVRRRASVRYAALGLLGLTVLKVFAVDLAAVQTSFRILSFLVLGVVLLLVSLIYQKGLPKSR
jgi:uncharacterized membrane protein